VKRLFFLALMTVLVFTVGCSNVKSIISIIDFSNQKGIEEEVNAISSDLNCDFLWDYVEEDGKSFYFVGVYVQNEPAFKRFIVCKNDGVLTQPRSSIVALKKGYRVVPKITGGLVYKNWKWSALQIVEK